MKASCDPQELKVALALAGKSVSRGATLPVLSNVHLCAEDDSKVAVSGTDLEVLTRTWIDAEVEEGGVITVPHKTLSELVRLVPSEAVSLSMDGSPTLRVEGGPAVGAEIKGIPAEEFIEIPDYDQLRVEHNLPAFTIDPYNLGKLLDRVAFSASKEESRPVLTCVHLHRTDEGDLIAAAADGFRLSTQHLTGVEVAEGFPDVLIPRASAEMVRSVAANETEPITAVADTRKGDGDTYEATKVAFLFQNTHVITQLLTGKFPDYGQIIPTKFWLKAQVSVPALERAVKTCMVFAKEGANIIAFTVEGEDHSNLTLCGLSAETGENESQVHALVTITGDIEPTSPAAQDLAFPHKFALNGQYVLEVLRALSPATEVEIYVSGKGTAAPLVFRPVGEDRYIHVIMPMHIAEPVKATVYQPEESEETEEEASQ